jgi:hypothetical protein
MGRKLSRFALPGTAADDVVLAVADVVDDVLLQVELGL